MAVRRLEPEQFDWRSGAGGAEEVRRIAAAAAAHDEAEALNEDAVLTLTHRGLDGGIMLLAHDVDGADGADGADDAAADRKADGPAQGFAYVHGLSGAGRPEVDLVVAPQARGRGVGTELARGVLDAVAGIPLTAWSHGNHPAAAALARTLGKRPVRELWVMRRPAAPVPAWEEPEGYRIRAFRPGEDDAGFLAVNAKAFSFHPEQGRLDQAGLDERTGSHWFDPEGFLVAEHDGELKGFHWTKVHAGEGGGPGHGEVYVIGVDPSTQGSGLGKALLLAGLDHLQSQGLPEVILYVEADNDPAVRLYEKYGFIHRSPDTHVMYA